MCQSVTVNGKYTGEVQELADMLGVAPTELVWRKGDPMPEIVKSVGYKHCLCPIDLEATAEKFGYEHSCDNWNDYIFTSKDA